ncbi:MAG: hypothetical protein H7Z42_18750 [Roseiflexaceae bacterium]|nr:hypothetical protein [Roseiflexaceae bacterium]
MAMTIFGMLFALLILACLLIGRLPDQELRVRWLFTLVAGVGLVVLWFFVYIFELLFVESHLVGYYCCVTAQDLPALGSFARTVSDFFRTPVGSHLSALVLSLGTSIIIWQRLRRGEPAFALVGLLLAATFVYVVAELLLVSLGWSISTWLLGPQTSAYTGFDRTMYGIVFHLSLWLAFLWSIVRLPGVPGRALKRANHIQTPQNVSR